VTGRPHQPEQRTAERSASRAHAAVRALGPALLDEPVVFGLHERKRPLVPAAHGAGLVPTAAQGLAAHVERFGARPSARGAAASDALLDALEEVRLTGRGGGHFPVDAKWRAARAGALDGVVVANGAEGEPASAKDAALLQLRPHLVLDGLALAAEVVGATDCVVWLHAGDTATARAVSHAVAERRAAGLGDLPVRIAFGPDHYLTGESSAVVRGLSGGPALPLLARVPAAVRGVGGRPTVVQNVESLAMAALVARWGAAVDADQTLVTLVGPRHRVVLPLTEELTFTDLLAMVGWSGGLPAAVLVGGYGGAWLPWPQVADMRVSHRELRAAGASLGAGVVAPLVPPACGVHETARLLSYLAASSARQCGPCLFGLPALAAIATSLAAGRASRADLRQLDRFAAEVAGRGACHHPDGAVRLLRSAVATFADDLARHRAGTPCPEPAQAPVLPIPTLSTTVAP
jgi:NADH:ubiquinone oxidoreductase subunit F (NADH-binding)